MKRGKIKVGHLIGLVAEDGSIDMRYHQVNEQGVIMTGKCRSIPEILSPRQMICLIKMQKFITV